MGVGMGVGLANRRSLPPQGSWRLNVYYFYTCSGHRVEKSGEVPGMGGKVSSRVKGLKKERVKEQ